MMLRVLCSMCAVVLLSVAAAAGPARQVTFGDGKVVVTIPSAYVESFDEEGTLQLIEVPNHAVRFYLSHHDLGEKSGEEVVRLLAQEKGLTVEKAGSHYIAVENGPKTAVEGESVGNVHRLIGFEHSLVVFSTAIADSKLASQPAKAFLDTDLKAIIGSLKQK